MRASRGLVTHHLAASSQQLCHHDASRLLFLSRFQCWTVSCCCISFDRLLWGVVADGQEGGGVLFFSCKNILAFPQLFCATSKRRKRGRRAPRTGSWPEPADHAWEHARPPPHHSVRRRTGGARIVCVRALSQPPCTSARMDGRGQVGCAGHRCLYACIKANRLCRRRSSLSFDFLVDERCILSAGRGWGERRRRRGRRRRGTELRG